MTVLLLLACAETSWFEGRWELLEIRAGGNVTQTAGWLELAAGDFDSDRVAGTYEVQSLSVGDATLWMVPDGNSDFPALLERLPDDQMLLDQNTHLLYRRAR